MGKSTLADLLVRFYDPDAGAIRIDGRDLRDLPLASVRHAIMLVDQAPYLFHASVRENIAYARPDATDDEIVSAAKPRRFTNEFSLCPMATTRSSPNAARRFRQASANASLWRARFVGGSESFGSGRTDLGAG